MQFPTDLVTVTEEILNRKLHFFAVPATIFTLFMSFVANNKNWAKVKAVL